MNLDRPIRVLLWSVKGAGEHYTGAGLAAYRMYAKDGGDRFKVTLAHFNRDQAPIAVFDEQHCLGSPPVSAFDLYRQLRAARRWLRAHANRFDVFHGLSGFHLTVGPAAFSTSVGLPVALKLTNHNLDLADKPGIARVLNLPRRRRRMVRELDAVIAISGAIADELAGYDMPQEKIARIPNGVDIDRFRPARSISEKRILRAELGWPNPDQPVILFAGGVNQRKRPHLIVEALPILHSRGQDYTVVLLGPHDEPAYLRRMQDHLHAAGLADRLVAPGYSLDPAPAYRAADMYCLPSSNEGMPNSVLEAMATGLPCIVTPISGSVDLITDGSTGIYIEPDSLAIADSIVRASNRPTAEEMGAAARNFVTSKFSLSVVLDMHERLFRRLMSSSTAHCRTLSDRANGLLQD